MDSPCPGCGTTMKQSRADGRCLACGKPLPAELRYTPRRTTIADPSHWKIKEMPVKRNVIALNGTFSLEEVEAMRYGLVPEQMEDKWFVYWQEDALHFFRSWTGICVYIVRFVPEGASYRMVEAIVNRDPDQYKETDDKRDAKMISFLIGVLLLHKSVEFPSDEANAHIRAAKLWAEIGRAMMGQHPGFE